MEALFPLKAPLRAAPRELALMVPQSSIISAHNAPGVTIGSLEGDAFVFLGANNLTIGSNNLSTTFAGVIDDGGTGGSLTKIGTETLDLTGANTYTGDTNVNRGVLQVDGSITSNTFVNRGSTLAGTGTISGNVTNSGKVSPGSAGTPGVLTVVGNYTQAQYATLMIQLAGANAGEFGVLNVLGIANLGGQLDPVLLNGFVPTIGESFTFLTYGSVNGTLIMLNRNIDNLPEHWEVSYFPTFATLTVEPGNVSVPDRGSTFLLLTLSLLGLVTYRRQLLRGQP
jgi:autotransporter-associated beta strand protein